MTTETAVWDELRPLRQSLQADSADLEVTGFDSGVLRVRLAIGDESCADCIMDKAMLELLIARAVAEREPRVQEVRLDDPRLASGAGGAPQSA